MKACASNHTKLNSLKVNIKYLWTNIHSYMDRTKNLVRPKVQTNNFISRFGRWFQCSVPVYVSHIFLLSFHFPSLFARSYISVMSSVGRLMQINYILSVSYSKFLPLCKFSIVLFIRLSTDSLS